MIADFKFSVVCEWCVIIEEKDNLLQLAKVFLTKCDRIREKLQLTHKDKYLEIHNT